MIVPSKKQKTYGVLHTENYFSFLGFCKKVNSDEIQKVDIYLDDILIDTIIADKHLQKIEDIYDLEGFGFEYILPNKYIGQKSIISFKNHQTQENLQNSPYILIDENHPKFNEFNFFNSLYQPINEEKIKDVYCPNSIGFLATKENLEDEEFVGYINQIMSNFRGYNFKALFFDNNTIKEIKELFKENENLELLELKESKNIYKNLEVLISNYTKNKKELIIVNSIANNSTELLPIGVSLGSNLTIQEQSKNIHIYYKEFFENIELFGFTQEDLKEYKNGFSELFYLASAKKYGVTVDFNLNDNIKNQLNYLLQIGFKNHQFFKDLINLRQKLKELKSK